MHTTHHEPKHRRHTARTPLAARLAQIDPDRLAEYRDNVSAADLTVVYGR